MRGIGNKNIQETKSDFSTKFDRLYATQKYIAAFDLCIQNVKTSSIEEVQKKAKLVIPKIKNNLEILSISIKELMLIITLEKKKIYLTQ